jgi:uncharacterized damage-inducible protein DinB
MKTHRSLFLICLLATVAFADEPAPSKKNPLSAHQQMTYGVLQKIVLRSAELMPEERYGFKPAEPVRSYGEILIHIAESQYFFCSAARPALNPRPEQSKKTKAEIIAALREAFRYCDSTYAQIDDASGTDMVKLMRMDTPKLGVLTVNQMHLMEHYGNLVTYMRMNDIVPPTSDQEFMKNVIQ